eukprot:CAMPEP_0198222656 /NCGR_PEP_ID=MMETSP1445-20131203/89046_1 /TAXON_ID=36898 /ORGANISM="Pyramimonas sp., Strain CCMP2087" /LENGTH=218 /DNA_ID=CAMNT_0043901235 /DNA_START=172 /DNA_END=824 /DNA_ORIENTATION=+
MLRIVSGRRPVVLEHTIGPARDGRLQAPLLAQPQHQTVQRNVPQRIRGRVRRVRFTTRVRSAAGASPLPLDSASEGEDDVVGAEPGTDPTRMSWMEEAQSVVQQVGQELKETTTDNVDLLDRLDFSQAASRPHNISRSLVHVCCAMFVALVTQTLLQNRAAQVYVAGGICASSCFWEVGRKCSPTFGKVIFAVFRKIGLAACFHEEEMRKVTSWTYYT